jgi:Uma2 family endonuclease
MAAADLLFVAQSRLHLLHSTRLEGAADLVVEIVSPESLVRDWREKYLVYQAAGVREYWVIDPQARRFEVYSLNQNGIYEVPPEIDGRVSSRVIPGFYLKSEWLWQEPLPSAFDVLQEMGILP